METQGSAGVDGGLPLRRVVAWCSLRRRRVELPQERVQRGANPGRKGLLYEEVAQWST